VLGAGGFIGRRVCRILVQLGAEVIGAYRSPTVGLRGGTAIGVDLTVPGSARALVSAQRPSLTLNLAGYGVSPGQGDPQLAQRLNADLPRELALACAEWADPAWPGQHLVHAGSALEYGTAPGNLAEDTPPNPTTLYGQSKLGGTRAIAEASARGSVRAITTRLFSVYGPGEPVHRLLPSLRQAASGTAPIPLTAGEQRRDFTYVDDVVEGMLRVGSMAGGETTIINLATGVLTPVAGFVRTAAAQLGIVPERLQFGALPTRPTEMAHDPVTTAALVRLTGWQPVTSVPDGIRRTVAETDSSPR